MEKNGRLVLQAKVAVLVRSELIHHWHQNLCCNPLLQFSIQQLLVMNLLQMCKWLCPCWPGNIWIHQSWVPEHTLSCEYSSLVAELVARFRMADCHHSHFCIQQAQTMTKLICETSEFQQSIYLVMLCRPAQSKSTNTTLSTSLPSTTCPMMLGNRTSPCTVGRFCPSYCTVACC